MKSSRSISSLPETGTALTVVISVAAQVFATRVGPLALVRVLRSATELLVHHYPQREQRSHIKKQHDQEEDPFICTRWKYKKHGHVSCLIALPNHPTKRCVLPAGWRARLRPCPSGRRTPHGCAHPARVSSATGRWAFRRSARASQRHVVLPSRRGRWWGRRRVRPGAGRPSTGRRTTTGTRRYRLIAAGRSPRRRCGWPSIRTRPAPGCPGSASAGTRRRTRRRQPIADCPWPA